MDTSTLPTTAPLRLSTEERLNAERFRRLLLATSAAVIRVDKKDKDVCQITIEVTKGAKSNSPLRGDILKALDEMLELN